MFLIMYPPALLDIEKLMEPTITHDERKRPLELGPLALRLPDFYLKVCLLRKMIGKHLWRS